MMYASRITVDYKPKKVRYHREIQMPDGMLTLKDIAKHLKDDEKFDFQEKESNGFGTMLFMNIYGFRDETKGELDARVEREEKYNDNYEKFHLAYPKVKIK